MTQKRNYEQYPKELTEEAVALITEKGCTVAERVNLIWAVNKKITSILHNPLPATSEGVNLIWTVS